MSEARPRGLRPPGPELPRPRLKPPSGPPTGMRRWLGSPALFGIVQGFVAASLYFSLSVVAERALGLTWVVFVAGALLFALIVPCYVEGASLHQERGGATVIARYAFDELWSFVAGWAICLDYLILVALCAYTTTDYLGAFWSGFSHGVPQFLVGAGVVVLVSLLAARGPSPRRLERVAVVVLADLGLQVLLVLLGLALLFTPDVLTHPAVIAGAPKFGDLLFAFPLVLVAFSGIDASSGLAGQVQIGRRGLRRLMTVRLLSAMVPYVGLAIVASAVLPQAGGAYREAPVLGITAAFDEAWLREPLKYVIAVSAVVILVTAGLSAMLGLSRLGYALAVNRQIPSTLGMLHARRSTPVVIIALGAILAVLLLVPADLEFLAAICAVGATVAFTIVSLAVIRLRFTEPERDRPYKMRFNVRVGGGDVPVGAVLAALMSIAAFAVLMAEHGAARWIGLGWLGGGVAMYLGYRLWEGKDVFTRITVPEKALTREKSEVEYASILVPVFGTPLDDDIVQTAGRLASVEGEEGEGSEIWAIFIHVLPMSLTLDGRIPDAERERARKALARAKAVGEEYEGVTVKEATVRARRAGEAIVEQARRRGVEAIVLAAEEPSRMRGGLRLGGKQGLHDTFVGEMTRHVVTKAPCRVILTAPASDSALPDVTAPRISGAPLPPVPVGHPVAAPDPRFAPGRPGTRAGSG